MYSIGELSRRTGVKIPTIRFYENINLLSKPTRSEGNQRRFEPDVVKQLSFIRHCRDLGFSIDDIRSLLMLQAQASMPCVKAHEICEAQLKGIKKRLVQLQKLQSELQRITSLASHETLGDCEVLEALADHEQCSSDHGKIENV